MSGWRFGGHDWLWIAADLSGIASLALQISKDGVVVTNALVRTNKEWQVGIAEQLAGWTEPTDGGFNTRAAAALDYIKTKPEAEVIDAVVAFIKTQAVAIRQKWQQVSGSTDPNTDNFESAFEALAETINRDLLGEPNSL